MVDTGESRDPSFRVDPESDREGDSQRPYEEWTRRDLIAALRGLEEARGPEGDPGRLLHQLQVQKVELETQNQELRDLQARMEASRDLYADLYEFAPVAYLTIDPEGVIRSVNLTGAGMLGQDRASLIGRSLSLFVEPPDSEAFWGFLRSVLQERNAGFREIRLRGEEGRSRTVIMEGVKGISMEDGSVVARLALTDITERKRAEEVQRRSKRALQALHEVHRAARSARQEGPLLNQVCRFLTDVGGYTLACVAVPGEDSEGGVRFLARAGESGYLDRIEGVLSWQGPVAPWDPFGRAAANGEPATVWLIDPKHPATPLHGPAREFGLESAIALPLSDGERLMGILGVYSTEREGFQHEELDWLFRLADELATACAALRQRFEREAAERERDWLVEILDATPDFVEIADAEGNVLYRNPGAWHLLGLDPGTVRERGRLDRYQPQWARDRLHQEVLPAVREKGVWRGEMALQCADGGEVPVSQIVLGHRGPRGEIERVSTVAHDMRPFMEKRNELERYHRLIALGELASVLAHQLNQPLTAAANYTEGSLYRFATEGGDPESVRSGLEKALEQVRKAGSLVQNLRNFLRGGQPDLQPVSLNNLIRNLVPTVDARKFGIAFEFRLELTRDLPPVAADPIQIQETLLNLIHNAVEAMEAEPPSDPRVVIATHRCGDQVEIQVRDGGVGLPAELLENLDQPLFTTKEKGMGLGLPICSSVAEVHGGRFWAEPNPDAPGTTFHLTLPVAGPGTTEDAAHG